MDTIVPLAVRTLPRWSVVEPRIECVECGAPTTGGKRYCSAHVTRMPYASRLIRRIEREEANARSRGEVAA